MGPVVRWVQPKLSGAIGSGRKRDPKLSARAGRGPDTNLHELTRSCTRRRLGKEGRWLKVQPPARVREKIFRCDLVRSGCDLMRSSGFFICNPGFLLGLLDLT